jgi:hypothetical protein
MRIWNLFYLSSSLARNVASIISVLYLKELDRDSVPLGLGGFDISLEWLKKPVFMYCLYSQKCFKVNTLTEHCHTSPFNVLEKPTTPYHNAKRQPCFEIIGSLSSMVEGVFLIV